MINTRTTGLLAALLFAALLLAACGGGGESTVSQGVHDVLQHELEEALEELKAEREAKGREATARRTAEAEATRLTGELTTAQAEATRLTGELTTVQAEATRLTGELTTAEAEATRLTGELTTAQAEATRLEDLVGSMDDTANDAASASLYAQLNHATAEVTRLESELTTANARVTTLETLVGDATNPTATSLRGQIAELKVDLAAAQARVTALTGRLSTAESELEDEAERAAEAEEEAREARQEAAEIERQGDTNARGRGVLAALEAVVDSGTWESPSDMATARINEKNTAIEIVSSPLKGSTRTSGKFYTATLMRTAPGVGQPERKIVAYSDREKSRSFANHYASSIETVATVGGTKANPRFVHADWATADSLELVGAGLVSITSRGGHDATRAGTETTPPNPLMVDTLSARVHGVSGHYGCYNSTASKACKVNVAATYTAARGTATDHGLATLTITPETVGSDITTLYFDPGSDTVSLLNVANERTGAPATNDGEYITFGWWQEAPAKPDDAGVYTYDAAVFSTASAEFTSTSLVASSAEYEGPAVGLYVDLKSEGGKTIYESGDFTATAILRAVFGTGSVSSIEGDVTGFKTKHGNKSWHIKLDDGGTADIVQAGATSDGSWTHSLLARHGNAATDDAQPIAVTGRFDASIENVRHIVGAFGAHRTTDPLEP